MYCFNAAFLFKSFLLDHSFWAGFTHRKIVSTNAIIWAQVEFGSFLPTCASMVDLVVSFASYDLGYITYSIFDMGKHEVKQPPWRCF
jgi:hypothetical protein